ncbi:MAG: hypothetical protein LBL66_08880 [Clostridiales bacterium]|jgi:hypothetical protein|nr:hypothetical protein [Clostridiales bacterium]
MGLRIRNARGKRGAFLCSVEIAALCASALLAMTTEAFALLTMTAYSFHRNSNDDRAFISLQLLMTGGNAVCTLPSS